MRRPALYDLLPDFGSSPVPSKRDEPAAPVEKGAVLRAPAPQVDIAGLVAAETARAEAAVTERLSALYEATLQAERDGHEAERDELRRSLGGEAAAMIEARFAAMEAELLAVTTATAARILGSLLSDELQQRAIAALSARIVDAIRDSEVVRIRVAGPPSLCEPLAAALGEHAALVRFSERSGFDLSVDIDSSIYETRLAEWAAELAGVLE
jgi:hypothetical protein